MIIRSNQINTFVLVLLCLVLPREIFSEEAIDQTQQNTDETTSVESIVIPSVTLRLNYLRSTLHEDIPIPADQTIRDLRISERYRPSTAPSQFESSESYIVGNDEQTAIVVPTTESQRSFLQSLFADLSNSPEESATQMSHSVRSIPESVISSSTDAVIDRMERMAVGNWDFVGDCPSISTPERQVAMETLLKTVPDILMRSLVSQASKRVDTSEEAANLTLTIIKPFLPHGTQTLTDRQKVITYGTAIIGGAVAGTAYLVQNEVDFENEFSIPLRDSETFSSIGIAVEGENIGFDSNNPYIGLGTTLNFDNNLIISVAGGASRVTSRRLSGKHNAGFNISLPVSADHFTHRISLGGSISRTHKGPIDRNEITGGAYSGNLTYTTSPVFLRTLSPNLDATISVTPLRASGSIFFDPETGVPQDYRLSSEARANINYRIVNSDTWTGGFNFSITGGALFSPRGDASPLVEGSLGITIVPKRRN